MNGQRGSALIMALMMLTFLMILGSALLTSVTLDVAIGENYRSETQLLYLAEVGIENARRMLLSSMNTPSQLLETAAGVDGVLSASRDLDTILAVTDDIPFIHGDNRTNGRLVEDTSGRFAGRYFVFLRNDEADGISSLKDSNQVLKLLSVAILGNSRKVLEVTVRKWQFPPLPASLVLVGSPVKLVPPTSGSGISGIDSSSKREDRSALGVTTSLDRMAILEAIPDTNEFLYPGKVNPSPPPADVAMIDALLDSRFRTPAGIERIVDRIIENASDIHSPGWNGTTILGDTGSGSDYRVVVVNGDCVFGPGTGYGILLVRGNFRMAGSFRWNGLILVIGQGSIGWAGAGNGIISGGVFLTRTRANDRSTLNALGSLLMASGSVDVDFSGDGNSIQLENPGDSIQALIHQKFPYAPVAIREY